MHRSWGKSVQIRPATSIERKAMGLNVYLTKLMLVEVYTRNITHNLNSMADEAGIYTHLWRPEEIGITKAEQLVQPLEEGLKLLKSDPKRFRKFNAPNGWGVYENFVEFVEGYLAACKEHPNATVEVDR